MGFPFRFVGNKWPLNWGAQAVAMGAGGPSGFENAQAYHFKAWPNVPVNFFNFTAPWPYGDASTMARNPNLPNIWSGHAPINPLGYQKPLTGSGYSF